MEDLIKRAAEDIAAAKLVTALTATVSDYLIKGKAGEVLNRILAELEKIL
jgi:hypothetical protein